MLGPSGKMGDMFYFLDRIKHQYAHKQAHGYTITTAIKKKRRSSNCFTMPKKYAVITIKINIIIITPQQLHTVINAFT